MTECIKMFDHPRIRICNTYFRDRQIDRIYLDSKKNHYIILMHYLLLTINIDYYQLQS